MRDHGDPIASWEALRAATEQDGRSAAADAAARWALDVLERELGPQWPAGWRQHGAPPEVRAAGWSLAGLLGLLDLALELSALTAVPGIAALRRTLASVGRADQLASPRLQLRVAALAHAAGLCVHLEPCLPGASTRADLRVAATDVELAVEIVALVRDRRTLEADRWLSEVTPGLHILGQEHGVDFSGVVREPPGETQTDELLVELERRGRAVQRGVVLPPLRMPGIEVTVAPAAGSGGATRFELPRVDIGRRLGGRLREKARQARSSAARWLVVDLLDSRWQLSSTSGADLHATAATLAGKVRAALGGHPQLVGVVLTDGAVLLRPDGQTAQLQIGELVSASRVRLDAWRMRESVVVALRATAADEAALWTSLLADESGWTATELRTAGLEVPPEVHGRAPTG